MLVVTTPSGRIGRHVVSDLISAGERVRIVTSHRSRIEPGVLALADVVEGSIEDHETVAKALDGAEAVFWCLPLYPRTSDLREYCLTLSWPFAAALPTSTVRRVVYISSSGRGRARDAGPISAVLAVEELLEGTGVSLRSLRCGIFMEELLYMANSLRRQGTFFYPINGDFALPICAARDVAARAAGLLRDRTWTGQAGVGVHGPVDLSFNQLALIMSKVLERPIQYKEVSESAYRASLLKRGATETFAQEMVDMFREIVGGILTSDARTSESTTSTTFESWCTEILKVAIG